MLGPALALALFLKQRPSRPWFAAAGVVLLLLGLAAARQTMVWRDETTLFAQSLRVNPSSAALLTEYADRFVPDPVDRLRLYARAVSLQPDFAKALARLASTLLALEKQGFQARWSSPAPDRGQLVDQLVDKATRAIQNGESREAIQHLGRAIVLEPRRETAHALLGALLLTLGENDRAEAHLALATRLAPGRADTANNLAALALRRGDRGAALALLEIAAPGSTTAARNHKRLVADDQTELTILFRDVSK